MDTSSLGDVPNILQAFLVLDLSEKNPLQTLPYDATIISLLEIFARGTHRGLSPYLDHTTIRLLILFATVLIHSSSSNGSQEEFIGIVSDRRLLSWFLTFAQQLESESLRTFLSNPLSSFSDSLSSLNLYTSVVATLSTAPVLDAMKLMSEEGESSIAVLEEEGGTLLSAVNVTDIGKIVPSQSNQILSMPLKQFISLIKVHFPSIVVSNVKLIGLLSRGQMDQQTERTDTLVCLSPPFLSLSDHHL